MHSFYICFESISKEYLNYINIKILDINRINGGLNVSKIKDLIKNIGFLVISQFGIKVLNFLLVPLYTSVLTTSEYGTYDLFHITTALLIPFFTFNIKDSAIRFTLDHTDTDNRKKIFTISIIHVLFSSLLALIVLSINHIMTFSKPIDDYAILVFLMFISQALVEVITNYVRGLDNLKQISISSVICSLVIIILNIITLIPLKMGLYGYFISNIVGPFVQVVYLFIVCKCWRYLSFRSFDKNLNKQMVNYSRPLILNTTAWWINSVSDRYIVVLFCGTAANGIYSVASKIPSILDMMQNIFSQAWTISAVKEFDKNDSDSFFSNMYNTYNMVMTIMCSCIIIISRLIARVLYSNDFFLAWKYVPFLVMAVLFGALSGYIGAIFSAVKASKVFAYSTLIGAAINIIFNFIFVRHTGPIGAAISTTLCYFVIYVIRLQNSSKYIKMKLFIVRDTCTYILLMMQSLLLFLIQNETIILYMIETILLLIIILFYKNEISKFLKVMKKAIFRRKIIGGQ